ncbi:TetR/AcrR family transcriptional regulator [Saccharopolyspora elongata]|uniref:TetR/AcrR family transcriptional regulator n=1 Tax=Saccharopolyspora elongata TaxID=2530387 RepID=A0A4R4ZAU7_9PSEU|nr:TetR/AcrR family transcriptional regulator [Saccharopolyspora elongata]TDD53372.1 TetR/AcrR family transcriptional regulator [Saccharopolyspora elongata]
MSVASQPLGRRERNKQAKLERITAAASELFAEHGVDEVTTQQIADAADIGTGTLFLYAKTKGELLLLVQNAHYATALERGRTAAAEETSAVDAVVALLAPVVECNRVQVDNGRTYLREMVFGDPTEPHHAEALAIVGQTEEATAGILTQHAGLAEAEASTLARVISAIMFLGLAASVNVDSSIEEILASIRTQVAAILPR